MTLHAKKFQFEPPLHANQRKHGDSVTSEYSAHCHSPLGCWLLTTILRRNRNDILKIFGKNFFAFAIKKAATGSRKTVRSQLIATAWVSSHIQFRFFLPRSWSVYGLLRLQGIHFHRSLDAANLRG